MKNLLVCFAFLAILSSVCAFDVPGKNTLVLLDDLQQIETYSNFFGSLQNRGYTLDYHRADDPNIALSNYGEFQYDSLIILAPKSEEFGGSATVANILEFVDEGHDVLIAADSDASFQVREIASACGIELDDEGAYVIDHLNFHKSDFNGQHTLIEANNFADIDIITGANPKPVLYRGVGLALNSENSRVFAVLSGSGSAYSANPREATQTFHAAGTATTLVASLQARNSARVTVSGSMELFSNEFFSFAEFGNEAFVDHLTKWTLHERGLIRATPLKHAREGETQSHSVYTVEETLVVSVDIQEWTGEEWIAFKGNDVQIEFVMLDPYIRRTLSHDNNSHFSTTFKIPDVYGIYTLGLEYHKLGYTSFESKELLTVRPLRHDQFERFITSAFPYYASAFSMLGSVVLFSALFLFNRSKK